MIERAMSHGGTAKRSDAGALPAGSCDCQIHVYGDRVLYPIRHSNPLYDAPDAPLAAAAAMHRQLGFARVVVVQATVYTTDHSLLIDTLAEFGPERCRGIAIVDDSVGDKELDRLHSAGVRGARFNFQKRLGLVPSVATFRRSVARLAERGWFIKVFAGPTEMAEFAGEIDRCPMPVVIDHMGQLNTGGRIDPNGLARVLDMLKRGDRWIMLSNGHRTSVEGPPWNDAVPLGRAYYEAAPDRCIWGSDWPHVGTLGKPAPDDAELLRLLLRYLPDEQAVERVLVENPARLFGF